MFWLNGCPTPGADRYWTRLLLTHPFPWLLDVGMVTTLRVLPCCTSILCDVTCSWGFTPDENWLLLKGIDALEYLFWLMPLEVLLNEELLSLVLLKCG